jgi:hypothetical protein
MSEAVIYIQAEPFALTRPADRQIFRSKFIVLVNDCWHVVEHVAEPGNDVLDLLLAAYVISSNKSSFSITEADLEQASVDAVIGVLRTMVSLRANLEGAAKNVPVQKGW